MKAEWKASEEFKVLKEQELAMAHQLRDEAKVYLYILFLLLN